MPDQNIPIRTFDLPRGGNAYAPYVTSLTTDDLDVAVMISGGFSEVTGVTVTKVTENEPAIGRLAVVENDGACSVQDAGYMWFPFTEGDTPTRRQGVRGGQTAGTVKGVAHSDGGRGQVVSVDRTNLKVYVKFSA